MRNRLSDKAYYISISVVFVLLLLFGLGGLYVSYVIGNTAIFTVLILLLAVIMYGGLQSLKAYYKDKREYDE